MKNINRKEKIGKSKIILLYVGAGILIPLLILYFCLSNYYENHLYKNTFINGVNASNMTVSKVEEAINAEVKSYVLTLEERYGVTVPISGEDIGLHTVYNGSIEDILDQQNGFAWPITFFKTYESEIETMLEYDDALLKERFAALTSLKEENVEKPVNAHISDYGENGYEIIPEIQGNKVNQEKLYAAMQEAIICLHPTLSLEEADCYVKPKISSEHPKLVKALEEMNKLAGAEITYKFGEDIEILDGSKINEWISVNKKFKVNLDKAGLKEYVDYIGKTYNSFGRTRTFTTSYDEVIEVKGGDYGWWLDRGTELTELTKLVEGGEKTERKPAYFQTAQKYGADDIGDTYVEINLTAQHLFFYKDGKLIVDCDFVSGNVSKNYATPVGTYPIQYKENDATLTGEDYATPVKYWMPFNGNIGMHDASWRAQFGKDIYLRKGSHGCINMPPAAAKKVFEDIKRGVAVVVYELPGTENYEIEGEGAKGGIEGTDEILEDN